MLAIERTKWDLIILDEGQRIKNWEAKTSRIIKSLRSRFALVLSGTPLENRLDDLVLRRCSSSMTGAWAPLFASSIVTAWSTRKARCSATRTSTSCARSSSPCCCAGRVAAVMKLDLPPRTTEIVRIAPTDEQAGIDVAHMQIVSTIVGKKSSTEMDLLRLQKALLMCRMKADSTFLVDKQTPG